MTSFRQIEANRRNALKSTGPITARGKARSRRNAMRHGLTAETVISSLEDAEDYKSFEAAITADYDAQTAVERELVLRFASLLWRLRRATTIETGLFEIQAGHIDAFRQTREIQSESNTLVYAIFGRTDIATESEPSASPSERTDAKSREARERRDPNAFATCYLRLANLPNFALDRLSRYEAVLWRQAGQILYALDHLGRRRPHESRRFLRFRSEKEIGENNDER